MPVAVGVAVTVVPPPVPVGVLVGSADVPVAVGDEAPEVLVPVAVPVGGTGVALGLGVAVNVGGTHPASTFSGVSASTGIEPLTVPRAETWTRSTVSHAGETRTPICARTWTEVAKPHEKFPSPTVHEPCVVLVVKSVTTVGSNTPVKAIAAIPGGLTVTSITQSNSSPS